MGNLFVEDNVGSLLVSPNDQWLATSNGYMLRETDLSLAFLVIARANRGLTRGGSSEFLTWLFCKLGPWILSPNHVQAQDRGQCRGPRNSNAVT